MNNIHFYSSIEENNIIINHLASLITINSDHNETILDRGWKNWYQIYKDYQYYINIMDQHDENILNVFKYEYNSNRFNISNKYVGLSFYHYLQFIFRLDYYYIDSINNTYIGHDGNDTNSIQGNEKYEFPASNDTIILIHTGFRPIYLSLHQFDQDAEIEFYQDMAQLNLNGAVDLSLPKPLYNTPPRSIFETATKISCNTNWHSEDSIMSTTSYQPTSPLPYQSFSQIPFNIRRDNNVTEDISSPRRPLPEDFESPIPETKKNKYYYGTSDSNNS